MEVFAEAGASVRLKLVSTELMREKTVTLCLLLIQAISGIHFQKAEGAELKLIAPTVYEAGVPFVVRVELRNNAGNLNRWAWDREVDLWVSDPSVSLSADKVTVRNGLGTALVVASGATDFVLEARLGGIRSEARAVRHSGDQIVREFSGVLPGQNTIWSGLVHVTDDVTVPAGHTLTIEPGTLVMIDGATTGTAAADLLVSGTILAEGSEEAPITITCLDAESNWGQLRHSAGSRGVYRHTFVVRGGRTSGEGHTGTGPMLRVNGCEVALSYCTVSDALSGSTAVGKGMFARDSALTLDHTVFSRMRMGPEIQGTSLLCTNSYFTDMLGPDDCDGIYLHDSGGKELLVTGSVFINGDDDAIDTLNSNVTVTNCLFRDWLNPNEDAKAISVFNGEVAVEDCLIADCFSGISAKWSSGPAATVHIRNCTIVTLTNGVTAAWKANAPGPDIFMMVTNCIVLGNPAIASHFGTTNVNVGYSLLSSAWEGTEVSLEAPRFVDEAGHNYLLRTDSPAIGTGASPAAGDQTDLGAFPFLAPEAMLDLQRNAGSFELMFELPEPRRVLLQSSPDLESWVDEETIGPLEGPAALQIDAEESGSRFFRIRIE